MSDNFTITKQPLNQNTCKISWVVIKVWPSSANPSKSIQKAFFSLNLPGLRNIFEKKKIFWNELKMDWHILLFFCPATVDKLRLIPVFDLELNVMYNKVNHCIFLVKHGFDHWILKVISKLQLFFSTKNHILPSTQTLYSWVPILIMWIYTPLKLCATGLLASIHLTEVVG